ncbi:MAG: hypothetical protein ACSHXL_04865 [Bacteroidota bacterium]
MKKAIILLFLVSLTSYTQAQEKFGNTANLGLGVGYYGYLGPTVPALNFNYEFDVAKNFTLAPFVSLWSYYDRGYYYKGYKYGYRNTIVPIGVKAYYYFDQLVNLDSKFDLYLGLSLGYNLGFGRWDRGYDGPRYSPRYNPLYFDIHLGSEYHFNDKLGIYLDLSTGLSTLGLAIHM